MDFDVFDNSLFQVIVCRDLTVIYRNFAARRAAVQIRAGESIIRILGQSAYDTVIRSEEAVAIDMKCSAPADIEYFAFTMPKDADHTVIVGVSSAALKLCEGAEIRIAKALPDVFLRSADCLPDRKEFDGRCADVVFDAPERRIDRRTYHDFGTNDTVDLLDLFLRAYELIAKRFHVVGRKIGRSIDGDVFRCRADVGEYVFTTFILSYLASGFRGASAELSGGEFVTTSFVCDAGDGRSRRVGIGEYFSLLGIGGFTAEMLCILSGYFAMLRCEVDGARLAARLSFPASLSYILSGEDGKLLKAIGALSECLTLI